MKRLVPWKLRSSVRRFRNDWTARREQAKLLASLRGDKVECNVCHWRGERFIDNLWHPGTLCPVCQSLVRHRMLAALLDGLAPHSGWDERSLFTGKEVLHFAPEKQLRDRVGRSARRYVTADLDRDDCDLRLDMSSMDSVQDNAFDTIIACDVLEHVPDDRAAMRELNRVLRPGGKALLTVPQKDPPSVTDEDLSVQSEEERTRRFGQKDHVRIYGDDFCQRLQEVGFTVHTLTSAQFPAAATKRHVLTPPTLNPDFLATNVRRLYLAAAN